MKIKGILSIAFLSIMGLTHLASDNGNIIASDNGNIIASDNGNIIA